MAQLTITPLLRDELPADLSERLQKDWFVTFQKDEKAIKSFNAHTVMALDDLLLLPASARTERFYGIITQVMKSGEGKSDKDLDDSYDEYDL